MNKARLGATGCGVRALTTRTLSATDDIIMRVKPKRENCSSPYAATEAKTAMAVMQPATGSEGRRIPNATRTRIVMTGVYA